jgi:O-antigen/teichoic acid export membrane protein
VNDVAFYNTAQKISSLVSLSLIIGAGMVANRFTYYYSQNKIDELKIIFQKITKLISILSIISFLIVFTIKDYILHIWGAEFLVASSSLLILSFGQMINAFFGPVGLLLNMTGYENMVLKAIISSLVLNLSLNMLLVPYWGIEGAAIATCSAIIFQNIYFYLVMQNKRILVGLK